MNTIENMSTLFTPGFPNLLNDYNLCQVYNFLQGLVTVEMVQKF